jgi:hypothetical protein
MHASLFASREGQPLALPSFFTGVVMSTSGTGGNDDNEHVVFWRRAPNDTDAGAAFGEDEPTSPGKILSRFVDHAGVFRVARGTDATTIVAPRSEPARASASLTVAAWAADVAAAETLLAWATALVAALEADHLIELVPSASRSRLVSDLVELLADLKPVDAAATLAAWLSTNAAIAKVFRDDFRIAAALCASASEIR